jgi:hypothetical protein
MRTVGSPFLSAEHHGDYEQEGFRIDRVSVVAVPSGAPVGEVVEPEHGAYAAADCRLNARGQALLRRLSRIRVHITEIDTGQFIYDAFTSILSLRHG